MTEPTVELEVLAHDECVRLLAVMKVGRVAWLRAGRPTVVPVNYAWDGEAVAIRTGPGAKLLELTEGEIAFEIDSIDVDTHTGWSVLVVGTAEEVTGDDSPATTATLSSLGLVSWVPGSKDHLLRLTPTNISGRRLTGATDGLANPFWRLSASE